MKRLFYTAFIPCLAAILAVVLLYPQNNLIPSRMLLYMLVWVLFLSCIRLCLHLLVDRFPQTGIILVRHSHKLLMAYAVLYGICLYMVSQILKSAPMTDYYSVYQTASLLSAGETVTDWSYFSMWTNNLGPLTILTFLMRIARAVGFSDPYDLVLGFHVVQMICVMLSIYMLAGRIDKRTDHNRILTQWFGVLLFTFWTPVWTSTSGFYSDQLSFGGGIIAFALFVHVIENRKRYGYARYLLLSLAGVIWAVAAYAKATAAVGIVAILLLFVLSYRAMRTYWKEWLIFVVLFALSLGGLCAYNKTYPSKTDEYRLKTPLEFWVAMGMVGNGTYSDNAYLIKECNYKQNVDERRDFCVGVIKDNLSNLYDPDHLIGKTSVIFGSGDILPISLMYPEKESFLWQCVYWEGAYYWKYTCISTGFFYAVLFMMLAGCILQAFRYRENDLAFVSYLTVFGAFLFLMFWEAQNKQLFNQIPWMTLAVIHAYTGLDELFYERIGLLLRPQEEREKKHGRTGTE